jgi:membrane associated rhomboid family serine protease
MAYSTGFSNPFGFTVTPWVKRLLIANAAVFVVTLIFSSLVQFLQFEPGRLIPYFWTPFTYMFVHGGFFHLLFNMLILFFFGPPLEDRWGPREFLKFYLLAGLGGAVLSIVVPYPIIGASAAVLGVMVAFAMFWPESPIYIWGIFPIKAKWLVGAYIAISVFYAVTGGQPGVAHLAHLGGALAAFGYLKSPWAPPAWGDTGSARKKGRDWGETFAGLVKRPVRTDEKTPVAPIAARRPPASRPADDVDQILEKISQGGLSSLTPDERKRLEEASRRFRAN